MYISARNVLNEVIDGLPKYFRNLLRLIETLLF